MSGLSEAQLGYTASPEMRNVGELVLHIADGRVEWFRRMNAPLSAELWRTLETRMKPTHLYGVRIMRMAKRDLADDRRHPGVVDGG